MTQIGDLALHILYLLKMIAFRKRLTVSDDGYSEVSLLDSMQAKNSNFELFLIVISKQRRGVDVKKKKKKYLKKHEFLS